MLPFFLKYLEESFVALGLILVLASFLGKLSPKSVCGFIILEFVIYFLLIPLFSLNSLDDTAKTMISQVTSENTPGDTLLINKKPFIEKKKIKEDLNDEAGKLEEKLDVDSKTERTKKQKEYEVAKEYRNYDVEGKWKWDDAFIATIENKTGWRKVRKGNYTISIDYQESFKRVDIKGERKFLFLGGEIKINVNNQPCCCQGLLTIPGGLDGKKVPDVKIKIQDTITHLLLENKDLVIDRISACL